MGKVNKTYKVNNFTKVDKSKYTEGDIFISDRSVGILANGEIKTFGQKLPNLKDYVKKSDVQKMIDEAMNKGGVQ